MPRIDPYKLLHCLGVLLAPNGGIRSSNEVKRLAGLMAKFSKKLVSKCIYIQILKCTETDLLCQFMTAGGWSLAHMWLTDGILSKNWPLVQEILELLLLCPVDVARLKSNSAPKLVKGLSKEGGNEAVRILATKLVEQWLKFVKSETLAEQQMAKTNVTPQDGGVIIKSEEQPSVISSSAATEIKTTTTNAEIDPLDTCSGKNTIFFSNLIFIESQISDPNADNVVQEEVDPLAVADSIGSKCEPTTESSAKDKTKPLVLKITMKDGKQVFTHVDDVHGTSPKVKNDTAIASPSVEPDSDDNKMEFSESDSVSSSSRDKKHSESDKNKKRDHERRNKDDSLTRSSSSHSSSSHSPKHRDSLKSSSSSSKHHSSSSSNKSSSSSSKSSSSKSNEHRDSKSSHPSSSSSSGSKDKDRERSRQDRDKDRNRNKVSSRDKDRERDRDREKSKKDHDRSKEKSSSNKDKEKTSNKESSDSISEKDKEALAKMTLPSINKLGKIPKKVNTDDASAPSDSASTKKPSISIEVRKEGENRPKTVKTFNSKFRSHGLAEEAPPPPSRKDLKRPTVSSTTSKDSPPSVIPTPLHSLKRSSPPPSTGNVKEAILEKKLKIDATIPEKPGGVKLISPKPSKLVESDMFMDAIFAASTKKDLVRKRKRKLSLTGKEAADQKSSEKSNAESGESIATDKDSRTVATAPLKFYQDTLEESDKDRNSENHRTSDETAEDSEQTENLHDAKSKKSKLENMGNSLDSENTPESPDKADRDKESIEDIDVKEERRKPGPGCGPDGPPGALVIHRRKGPKKQLKWRPQDQLEEIRYFESDENERVNVTKNFVDMKQMERYSEREVFMMARKMSADDTMAEQTEWKPLIEVDDVPPHPNGSNSKERKIQQDRERTVLKALYFNRVMIPDSPAEPDMEHYKITDPQIIPFEDIMDNADTVNNFTILPWPEPKGSPPSKGNHFDDHNQFNPNTNFGMQQFPFGNNGWQSNQGNMPPNMQNNMNMPQFGPGNGPMPPNMMNMNMDQRPSFGGGFGPNGPVPGPGGFNNFGPPPMDNMRMSGPPRGPVGGPNQGCGGWFRGPNGPNGPNGPVGPPPMNNNNWRGPGPMDNNGPGGMAGPGNMHGPGGGPRARWLQPHRICKSFQKGYCRKGDSCTFLHPGINCPPF